MRPGACLHAPVFMTSRINCPGACLHAPYVSVKSNVPKNICEDGGGLGRK